MVSPVPQAQQITASRQPDWAQDDRLRFQRYQEARDFVDGLQWATKAKRGEKRLIFNYARALPRKVAAYTIPQTIRFTVAAETEDLGSKVEKRLAEVLGDLDVDELDEAMTVEASTIGDAIIKVTWNPGARAVVLGQVDPATVAASYDPTHPDKPLTVLHRYQLPGAALAMTLGLSADQVVGVRAEGLYPVEETWDDVGWALKVNGEFMKGGENPYGWNPYVFLSFNRKPRHFWGEPDIAALYDPLRELNARMSIVSTILELSGAPIAVLENVEGSDGVVVKPGAKWEIPEGAKAYLLDLLAGQGIKLHIDYIDLLYRTLHDLAEAPRTSFGDTGRALSGVALETEIQPLIQQVRRKRRALARYYRSRNERILDLLERFGGEDLGGLRRTVPIWPEVLPSDREAEVRQAVQLVAGNITSRRTAAEALGSADPEKELRRVIEEARMIAAAAPAPAAEKGNDDGEGA